MPLCLLAAYLPANKDILRLGELLGKEDKQMMSAKHCYPRFLQLKSRPAMPNANLEFKTQVCYVNFEMKFLVLPMNCNPNEL